MNIFSFTDGKLDYQLSNHWDSLNQATSGISTFLASTQMRSRHDLNNASVKPLKTGPTGIRADGSGYGSNDQKSYEQAVIYESEVQCSAQFSNPLLGQRSNGRQCEHCKKIFTRPSSVLRHQQTCGNLCAIPCELCDQTFTRLDNLHVHMQVKHGLGPSLECSKCGKRLRSKIKLHEHIANCGQNAGN